VRRSAARPWNGTRKILQNFDSSMTTRDRIGGRIGSFLGCPPHRGAFRRGAPYAARCSLGMILYLSPGRLLLWLYMAALGYARAFSA
jgi:hypothetical protein